MSVLWDVQIFFCSTLLGKVPEHNRSTDPSECTGCAPQGWETRLRTSMVPMTPLPFFGAGSDEPAAGTLTVAAGAKAVPKRLGLAL